MSVPSKRIAVNFGGGYVPGLNAVVTGTVLAAHELGWDVVGIRDGFDGLLAPERYPDGGLLALTPAIAEGLSVGGGAILGNATRTDPFRVRQIAAGRTSGLVVVAECALPRAGEGQVYTTTRCYVDVVS